MNRIIKRDSSRLYEVTKALLLVTSCFMVSNLWAMGEDKQVHTKSKFTNSTELTIFVKVYFPAKHKILPFLYKIKKGVSKNIVLREKKGEVYVVASKVEIIARNRKEKYEKGFPRFYFKANKEYFIIAKDSIVIEPTKKHLSAKRLNVKLVCVSPLGKRVGSEYGSFEALPTKEEFEKKKIGAFVNIKEDENDLTNNNTSTRRFFNKSAKGFTIEGSNFKTNLANIEMSDSYFDVKFKNEYFDKDKEYKIIFRLSNDRKISKMYKISDLKRNVIYEISIVPFDII